MNSSPNLVVFLGVYFVLMQSLPMAYVRLTKVDILQNNAYFIP